MPAKWLELKTLEVFRTVKSSGVGYVVITDTATGNKVHKPSCMWVQRDYFNQKVIVNHCRNGHYYWTDSLQFAQTYWGATICPICGPSD